MNNIKIYKKHILKKLFFHKKVGELYTPIENLSRGLPSHMKNMKEIEKAMRELLNEGLLEQHKKFTCISIHRHKIAEIKKILGI